MTEFVSKANIEQALKKIKEYADKKLANSGGGTETKHYVVINGANNLYNQSITGAGNAGTFKLDITYTYNGTQYKETLSIDVTKVSSEYQFSMQSNNFRIATSTNPRVGLIKFTRDGLDQDFLSIIFLSDTTVRYAGYMGQEGIFKEGNVNVSASYTGKNETESEVAFSITVTAGSHTGQTGYAISVSTPFGAASASSADDTLKITSKFTNIQLHVSAARPGATVGQNIITTSIGANAKMTPLQLKATQEGGGAGNFVVTWPDNTKSGGLGIILI